MHYSFSTWGWRIGWSSELWWYSATEECGIYGQNYQGSCSWNFDSTTKLVTYTVFSHCFEVLVFIPFAVCWLSYITFKAIIKIELRMKLYLALYFAAYCDLLEEHFLSRQKMFLQKTTKTHCTILTTLLQSTPKANNLPLTFPAGSITCSHDCFHIIS